MNYQKLLENATAKKFEIRFSEDRFGDVLVGIGKGKGCYHWFTMYGEQMYFNHTYSCNTGSIKKGISHAVKVQESLGFYNN